MNIALSQKFRKTFRKLSKKIQDKFGEKIDIFRVDEFNYILNNHKLHGEYSDFRSISITGDVRAIYRKVSEENYYFQDIGTHSELYE